jgi:hypothetical protein
MAARSATVWTRPAADAVTRAGVRTHQTRHARPRSASPHYNDVKTRFRRVCEKSWGRSTVCARRRCLRGRTLRVRQRWETFSSGRSTSRRPSSGGDGSLRVVSGALRGLYEPGILSVGAIEMMCTRKTPPIRRKCGCHPIRLRSRDGSVGEGEVNLRFGFNDGLYTAGTSATTWTRAEGPRVRGRAVRFASVMRATE